MPRILLFVALVVFVLWLRARQNRLGKMVFDGGLPVASTSKLGMLSYEVEDVMRRIAYSGTLAFRKNGRRIVYSAKPSIVRGDAQGLDNLLGQFVVRGGRVVSRDGRTRRGTL